MARINDELPAVVDRLLWLIGSGKYVDENVKITRQKAAFIEYLRSKLDAKCRFDACFNILIQKHPSKPRILLNILISKKFPVSSLCLAFPADSMRN
jgi:hypothetical protein